MKNIAIFASGEGTNAQKIIDHFNGSSLARVTLVVSNNPSAKVLQRAATAGVPTHVISRDAFYESDALIEKLKEEQIDLVVLAGFLWMIPASLVKAFPERIVNIHPALLPKFGGKGMYGMHVHKAVIDAGEKESGITIHFVNERYDEGRIIAQHSCAVSGNESCEMLAEKIHALEHLHFPAAIEKVLSGL